MRLSKTFQLALNILVNSKLRSWLTIIGIIIGIAAVVSIVSISQGGQYELERQLGELGADVLTITPGTPGAMFFFGMQGAGRDADLLSSRDISAVSTADNVLYVMGEISGRRQLSYGGDSSTLNVRGVNPVYWTEITNEKIDSGRFLSSGDTFSVVLGGDIVDSVFDDIPINSNVLIEGRTFRVVGILESGNNMYIPHSAARAIIDDIGENEFTSASVKIEDILIADETVEEIEKKLMMSRGILREEDKDFTIINPADFQRIIREIVGTLGLFLTAIAAISLLVGGVGIANTMFTSVLEKTKEIGIMKAIGAKNKDILLIFLLNSGMIGLVGGVIGIIAGFFTSRFVASLTQAPTLITPELMIGALIFSMGIGMIAGAIPAYKASKLKPVDALRYE